MVVTTLGQPYNAGEKPPVIIAMQGHETKTEQNRVVVIISDNSAVEPYTSRGLGQQRKNVEEKPTIILYNYINRHAGIPSLGCGTPIL